MSCALKGETENHHYPPPVCGRGEKLDLKLTSHQLKYSIIVQGSELFLIKNECEFGMHPVTCSVEMNILWPRRKGHFA